MVFSREELKKKKKDKKFLAFIPYLYSSIGELYKRAKIVFYVEKFFLY
jgi:hypothetical protein